MEAISICIYGVNSIIHNNNSSNYNNYNVNNSNLNNTNGSNLNIYNSANITNKLNNGREKFKIYLRDLKNKLDNLDMDFDTMFNFYTKIINRTNFFHNQMINFNFKQISLESKKDLYTKRVKQIIEKNSKNIEDLIKINPKFSNLLKSLNIDISNDNFAKIVKEKFGNLEFISKVDLKKYEEFYIKCQKYFSDLKTFNEFIIFNLEKIVEEYSTDEASKEVLRSKFLKIKKNHEIEQQNAKVYDRIEYLNQIFIEVESHYIKEKSKLEKIEIAISEYKRINCLEPEYIESPSVPNGNYKGFPFIDPYSNWPIEKLEFEKINTHSKIAKLKKFIDLKLYLEDENNRNIIFKLDIPLEKQIYGFLNGINYLIENLKLTRSVVEVLNSYLSTSGSMDNGSSINEGGKLYQNIFNYYHYFYKLNYF